MVKNRMWVAYLTKINSAFLTRKNILKWICIPIVIFYLSSCSKGEQQNIPADLLERVELYYTLEKNNQWELAYEVRSEEFKSTFDKVYYVSVSPV